MHDKSTKKPDRKNRAIVPPKRVAVLKNSLTKREMDRAGADWVNHQGPYMTVAETIEYAARLDAQTNVIAHRADHLSLEKAKSRTKKKKQVK